MIIWPRPEEFRKKYASRINDPVYLGYHFHLYIDRVFFSDYLPKAVDFLDKDGHPAELRRDVCSVRLRKSGQIITPDQYLSEEYYYGDYTRMNTWLCERYTSLLFALPVILIYIKTPFLFIIPQQAQTSTINFKNLTKKESQNGSTMGINHYTINEKVSKTRVCPTGIIRVHRRVCKQILAMRRNQKVQESNKKKHCCYF